MMGASDPDRTRTCGIARSCQQRASVRLQHITEQTGRAATAGAFHEGILEMLSTLPAFFTQADNRTWPHSVHKPRTLMNFPEY